MTDNTGKRPTDAELAILQVLWELSAGTVSEIHVELQKIREIGYTTALKQLQIMLDKGLVTRDASKRSHVYFPKEQETIMKDSLITDLAKRAFQGSAAKLAMQALSSETITEEEQSEIEKLLKQMKEK